jgi:hypothetical protein
MGDIANEYVDFLSDIPSPTQIARDFAMRVSRSQTLCIHGIIAEWCHDCKHLSKGSIKQILINENVAIVENLLSWLPESVRRTLSL